MIPGHQFSTERSWQTSWKSHCRQMSECLLL